MENSKIQTAPPVQAGININESRHFYKELMEISTSENIEDIETLIDEIIENEHIDIVSYRNSLKVLTGFKRLMQVVLIEKEG